MFRDHDARRVPWRLSGLLLLVALAGCAERSPDTPFTTYLTRLARTLDVAPDAPFEMTAPGHIPAPPRVGALQVPLERGRLDALDFLALHGCALQVTVGRKNSSLGRFARPSQALLLELEFLRLAPDCIDALRAQAKADLAEQLEAARQLKRKQLAARIFNATLGGEEYRAFWRTVRPPGDYPAVPDPVTLQALHAISTAAKRWLDGDYGVDGFEFELLLSEVAGGDGGGLLTALRRQAHWLGAADDLLRARAAQGPLCGKNLRHTAADILPNVVEKYFVAGIQPGAAALNRRYHELLPPVRELENTLAAALPEAFEQWRAQRDAVLRAGAQAPRRHVLNIQQLLQPCNALSVGR